MLGIKPVLTGASIQAWPTLERTFKTLLRNGKLITKNLDIDF